MHGVPREGAWIGCLVAGAFVVVQGVEAECDHVYEGFSVIVEFDGDGTAVVIFQDEGGAVMCWSILAFVDTGSQGGSYKIKLEA